MLGGRIAPALVGGALCLAGCTTVPRFTVQEFASVESLFYTLEQELCEAVADIRRDPVLSAQLARAGVRIERQFAKATANLKLIRAVDAEGAVSMVIPVGGAAAVTAGFGGNAKHEATVDASVSVYYPFTELQCGDAIAYPPPRIAGGLGLREWVSSTTRSLIRVEETPAAYSYEVSFELTQGGYGKAGVSDATPRFRLVGADLSAGVARQATHGISVIVQSVAVDSSKRRRGRVPQRIREALDRQEGLTILRKVD